MVFCDKVTKPVNEITTSKSTAYPRRATWNYRNYRNYTARLVWETNSTRPKQTETACFYLTTANSKARSSHCIGAHFTSCVRYGVNIHMDSVATWVWHQLRPSVLKSFIPLYKEIRRNATLGSWYRLVLIGWWVISKELGKYQARCISPVIPLFSGATITDAYRC